MSPELEITRGHNAKRVLDDPMYQEAFATVQKRVVDLLAQAETYGERRERLNHLLVALHSVKGYLEQVVVGGKMAAEQIERERTLKERMFGK